jgi:hypothetical protein
VSLVGLSGCSKQKFIVAGENVEFGQNVVYSKDVDVLWVIDTSGSMAEHQDALAQQVAHFVSFLDATGLKYQMAVTTMDMSSSGAKGKFVYPGSNLPILSPSIPHMADLLSQRIRLGDGGSPVERGLEAMKMALSAPNISTGINSGFLRENALLVVNFLSNEDDTASPSHANPDFYSAFLDQIRPPLPYGDRSWMVNFMGVVPNDPTCTTLGQYISVGYSYMALAQASGGAVESICGGDLSHALANMKERILQVTTEYALDRKPVASSIVVYIDGALLAQDQTNGWTYYEASNSIRFHGNGVPKANARIRVVYDPSELR